MASPASGISPQRKRIIIVVGIALVLYGAYQFYLWRSPYEWSGTVEARTISIGSRVGGRVKQVFIKEGDRIKAGAPLLELEPGDLLAQRLVAEGQLEQARANLDKLERGARPEEIAQAKARAESAVAQLDQTRTGARREQVGAAQARLQAAQAAADKAIQDQKRMESLLASGAASQVDKDNADTALRTATAQRDAIREQFEELKNGSRSEELRQAQARALEARASAKLVEAGARVEDLRAAKAMVDAAQGRLESIGVMIDELIVRAPRDARVESFDLRPGDIVAPNATAATLLEEDQLYVRIYVPETKIGLVRIGQKVGISVDSFPRRQFQGEIQHISAVGEYSPRNLQTADERADQVFATRVNLIDGKNELRAGMAAFMRVPK